MKFGGNIQVVLIVIFIVFWFGELTAATKTIPDDYETIQAAVDALITNPSLGDTIKVRVGNYDESITITGANDLTIEGEEAARTFLESSSNATTLNINASSNVIIRNLSWVDSTNAIQVGTSSNIDIANNVFNLGDSGDGVTIDDLSSVKVQNNTFYKNDIAVNRASDAVQIQNNIFSNNAIAINTVLTGSIAYNCFFNNKNNGATGSNAITGNNPRFVDSDNRDFHLKQDSPCIDEGTGTDGIDDTTADLGAYGGPDADVKPYPAQNILLSDQTSQQGNYTIQVSWDASESYLVTNDNNAGGYKVYYDSDVSGSPYNGVDSGGGTEPSPIDVGNITSYTLDNLSPDQTPPAAPILDALIPANEILQLTWNTVEGASGYKLYYGINDVSENVIDVGNDTRFTLRGLENGTNYRLSVTAVRQSRYYVSVRTYDNTGNADHVSKYSSEKSIVLGESNESALSNEQLGMPEAVVPYPLLPDEGCFIATAAFGYYSASEVQLLRDFRDQYLLSSRPGQSFVRWYYLHGPKFARIINNYPEVKPIVRGALYPLILFASVVLDSPIWGMLLLLVLASILCLILYRAMRAIIIHVQHKRS